MNTSTSKSNNTMRSFSLEKQLPSRVSRKGLPCPELHDAYRPIDEHDFGGFIKVEPKDVREMKRRRNAQRAMAEDD